VAWSCGVIIGEALQMQPHAFTMLGFSRFRNDGGEVGEVERLFG